MKWLIVSLISTIAVTWYVLKWVEYDFDRRRNREIELK